MEVVQDHSMETSSENVKINTISDGEPLLMAEASLCHTSNGVAELSAAPFEATDAGFSISETPGENAETLSEAIPAQQCEYSHTESAGEVVATSDTSTLPPEEEIMAAIEAHAAVESLLNENKSTEEITEEIIETSIDTSGAILCNEVTIEGSNVEVDSTVTSPDKVTLRTEILVEKSEEDIPDEDMITNQDNANNILSELDQGLELSEALRSSDTTNHGENNNGAMGEEVFNKEELLDILEGNDQMPTSLDVAGQTSEAKSKRLLETQIALNQLSRLHKQRSSRTKTEGRSPNKDDVSKKRRGRKKEIKELVSVTPTKAEHQENPNNTEKVETTIETEDIQNDNIVNTLVKDWDDDEAPEADKSSQSIEENNKSTDEIVNTENTTTVSMEISNRTSTDSPSVEGHVTNQSKSGDESQLPRGRAGRVIKKKVIFDPDNPDTFTKGKAVTKTKEPQLDKEQPPSKKIKPEQTPQRAKSKSPISKQQWKKPAAKNTCKQNKRLTEVDKLLMDEGAVNMLYQLTPEAPQGQKTMRTKAEIIKKMQSSTPEGNKDTMKFRERKKEVKGDGEAKKIVGGKSSRSSMSGSIKSPSAAEDFETHSADDSIIYRRHSSSSYSSACMSPRRLSDVEGITARGAPPTATPNDNTLTDGVTESDKSTDIFMADANDTTGEIINKDDCLSLKEKLNTKLSLALKKRKRENTSKTDKPPKQKRASKNSQVEKEVNVKTENIETYNHLSVTFDQRLAEICIKKSGSTCTIEMLKELEQALLHIDTRKDISVTLLISECGTLCSDLDLGPLLGEKMETRTNYAHALAEAVRSVLCTVESHGKLVVCGVWGACTGVALALVALSDVALAGERASFAVSAAPPLPGVAALTTRCSRLSHSLINDLLVFGRRVSAGEGAAGGLVSRCVPPAPPAPAPHRALAAHLAAQPAQSVILKKKLLNLNKSSDSESTFLTGLEKERDLLVEYWTSVEGQEALRAALNS